MAIDDLSQEFLRVLLEYGGEADTSTIRSETGMTRGQVNHRFNKLDNLDWIEITRAEEGKGNRTPPKVAILTEEGENAIKSGEAGKKVLEKDKEDDDNEIKVSREQLEEFHDEIDGMRNRLNVVVEQMNEGGGLQESVESDEETEESVDEERIEKLEREVARLRQTVELLNEAVSEKNEEDEEDDTEEPREPQIDESAVQELRDQQEYLQDWMDVAQRHMIAMRMYVEDQDDDFNEYLEMAEEKQN